MKERFIDSVKFFAYVGIGIFMFFIPIEFLGRKTIPIDHIVKNITAIPNVIPVVGSIMITIGAVLPFRNKTWNKNKFKIVMSFLGIIGLIFTAMTILNIGPKIITQESIAPYVFKFVVVPVIIIVPIGSIFLAFLVDYGFMEFIGVFARPFMTKVFKVPGRAAVDAVSSFVGSYSIALLITNQAYKDGRYTTREAAVIATGFSTVSATFMIITANTLGIMDYWTQFFWTTLFVTFTVTAITSRIRPLKNLSNSYYYSANPNLEDDEKGNYLKRAYSEGMKVFIKSDSILKNTKKNLKEGIKLGLEIGPNIMSIGVISLILANYTPVFDYLGYIFYPLVKLLGLGDTLLVSKSIAVSFADMYVPAILCAGLPLVSRFIVGVLCISEILFLSASIPCVMSTEIPIDIKTIFEIWFWRAILTVIIATPLAMFMF